MTSGEIAALITAVGMSIAGILTAIAALVNARSNARNNAARMELLQGQIKALQQDNDHLRTENDAKTEHNRAQDAVILDQQVKIQKWQEWGTRIGRAMNEMQLIIGTYQAARPGARDRQQTGPLPPLEPACRDDE